MAQSVLEYSSKKNGTMWQSFPLGSAFNIYCSDVKQSMTHCAHEKHIHVWNQVPFHSWVLHLEDLNFLSCKI